MHNSLSKDLNEGSFSQESPIGPHDDLRTLDHDANTFEKVAFFLSHFVTFLNFHHQGGFLDCKCNWGLFRDRNVTLRKSKKIHHGMDDLAKKGWIEEFDGKKTLDWWVPGSKCDEVGGQDASTLPPLWTRDMTYDFYTPLMCRRWTRSRDPLSLHSYSITYGQDQVVLREGHRARWSSDL